MGIFSSWVDVPSGFRVVVDEVIREERPLCVKHTECAYLLSNLSESINIQVQGPCADKVLFQCSLQLNLDLAYPSLPKEILRKQGDGYARPPLRLTPKSVFERGEYKWVIERHLRQWLASTKFFELNSGSKATTDLVTSIAAHCEKAGLQVQLELTFTEVAPTNEIRNMLSTEAGRLVDADGKITYVGDPELAKVHQYWEQRRLQEEYSKRADLMRSQIDATEQKIAEVKEQARLIQATAADEKSIQDAQEQIEIDNYERQRRQQDRNRILQENSLTLEEELRKLRRQYQVNEQIGKKTLLEKVAIVKRAELAIRDEEEKKMREWETLRGSARSEELTNALNAIGNVVKELPQQKFDGVRNLTYFGSENKGPAASIDVVGAMVSGLLATLLQRSVDAGNRDSKPGAVQPEIQDSHQHGTDHSDENVASE